MSSKKRKWAERIFLIFLGYLFSLLFADLYNVTIKKWFFTPEAEVLLYAVSTTTLSPLSTYRLNDRYYEITSFKIVNGQKKLESDAKIRIEARGSIIGITPLTLKDMLEIDKDDNSCGFFKIGGLEPKERIKGEIHSFARRSNDRNKSIYGFDPVGNYQLSIKVY